MKTIYKYRLSLTDRQTLEIPLPIDNRFFSVSHDPSGRLCLWCSVDTDRPMRSVTVTIVGTGNPMPDNVGYFVGSVTSTPFVWHVFVASDYVFRGDLNA